MLRKDVKTITINKGNNKFGGGNKNLLIHTGRTKQKIDNGYYLGATFIHEATHTSLDPHYSTLSGWVNAQNSDVTFFNNYARNYPNREDMAVSFLAYLAVRYRADRFSESFLDKVEQAIPNRIKYFDNLTKNLEMNSF